MKHIAVFASGRGSNLAAILTAIIRDRIPAKVECVISDQPSPGAFDIARQAGIPTYWAARSQFSAAEAYPRHLIQLMQNHHIDLIVLAGYLKLIPRQLVAAYPGMIMNIHPALLPNFCGKGYYGLKVHEAVIASGVKMTGVTVHFVDEHYDTGPIILQETVPVLSDDTPERLAARVLEVEHRIYPLVIKAFCEDRLVVEGRKVNWKS